jgi:LmbE family N-acetylglucosaminyl deacetylase
MQLNGPNSDILVPDASKLSHALRRTTHLGIGAHADDVEILAWHGIAQCHGNAGQWFTGVVVSDGAGSPRSGPYSDFSNEQMIAQRIQEQRTAAQLGQYSAQLQLGYSSAQLNAGNQQYIIAELLALLEQSQPDVLYLHNLADAHRTHVVVARACLAALRQLPAALQPKQVYGVEVWRSLDWLPSQYRVALPLPADSSLQTRLLQQHDSQVAGGKHYERAVIARQTANATFSQSHAVDAGSACALAMDYRPLLDQPDLNPDDYLAQCLQEFRELLLEN